MTPLLDSLAAPVVLAPLGGGPSTPELAAAVTDAGGLGFLAAAYLRAGEARERLAAARRLTSGPLGVNVFMPGTGPADAQTYAPFTDQIRAWAGGHGVEPGEPRYDEDDYAAKLEWLTSDPPDVVSFTFGCPDPATVAALRGAGAEVWITVTTPEEAEQAAAADADALVLQGAEAGGHRGSFRDRENLPAYGLLALIDLVRARVSLPLVASGGIATGRSLAAVLCAGARAAQVGTAFMLAPEAGTAPAHRVALAGDGETVLTRAFTGRLARGIRNAWTDEFDGGAPIAYPEIHHVTAPIRREARARGDSGLINLWAGEAHSLARELPAGQIVRQLASEARAAMAGVGPPRAAGDLRALADQWYAAWNAHDIDRVLSHYAQDVSFGSPFIAALGVDPSGTVRGKAALRDYWAKALARYPDLRFEPLEAFLGVASVTLHYRGIGGILAAEVLELGEDGLVVRALAHYDRLP